MVAKLARVDRLHGFADLSIIERYASKFAMDPDDVWEKPYKDVAIWVWKWKEDEEYQERFETVWKQVNDKKTK
jgi:hypothetical protein